METPSLTISNILCGGNRLKAQRAIWLNCGRSGSKLPRTRSNNTTRCWKRCPRSCSRYWTSTRSPFHCKLVTGTFDAHENCCIFIIVHPRTMGRASKEGAAINRLPVRQKEPTIGIVARDLVLVQQKQQRFRYTLPKGKSFRGL